MTKYTTTFENFAKQGLQADNQAQLLRSLLETAKSLGIKDSKLTIIRDLVELDVPIHEQHLVPILIEELKQKRKDD